MMLLYVLQCTRQVTQIILLRFYENAFAETIPAYTVTNIAYEEHSGGIIFVLEAGHNRVGLFIRRVKPAPLVKLPRMWDYNCAYRVVRVVPVDKR